MVRWDLVQLVWRRPELEAPPWILVRAMPMPLPALGCRPMVEHTLENQERKLERWCMPKRMWSSHMPQTLTQALDKCLIMIHQRQTLKCSGMVTEGVTS
uniref:Uncharacterized protein n=1 Tax=Tanacetum cinerariifolium TaxID=118510 RepID=A0A6L2L3K1_TANCI|nr:hypothetical protein [Tanacetum cinerariifolium]